MLIRFKVKNYLSYDKEEEIPMICGKSVRSKQQHIYKSKKLKLLKFTAVLGANASGKSNLVSAMSFAKDVIIKEIPSNCENQYFRLNDERKTETSKFEFEIKLDEKYYAYGFELLLNKKTITEEWFYELKPDNSENLIFKWDISSKEIEFGKFDDNILEILKTYSGNMAWNAPTLFITIMNKYYKPFCEKYKTLAPFWDVYRWFSSEFIINNPYLLLSPISFLENKLDEINNLLPKLGLGLTHCKIVPSDLNEVRQHVEIDGFIKGIKANLMTQKLQDCNDNGLLLRGKKTFFILRLDPNKDPNNIDALLVLKLQVRHEQGDIWFDISEESDGTKRVFDLIGFLISAKVGEPKVYVIDEIDRCLHPLLTYKLIKMYLDLVDQKEIQLIVTTHESKILDLTNLLRRDEIWFVKKGKDGSSHLISLDQYGTHFDKKVASAYLDGRYEGVPQFGEYCPTKEKI